MLTVVRFAALALSTPRAPVLLRSQPLSSFYTFKRPGSGGMKRRNPGDPKTRWKRIPIDTDKNTISKKAKGVDTNTSSSSPSTTTQQTPPSLPPPPTLSSSRNGTSKTSKRWQMRQDSDMYVKAVRSNRERLSSTPALSAPSPLDSATTRAYKLHKAKTATFVHALSRASFKLEEIEEQCFPPSGGLFAGASGGVSEAAQRRKSSSGRSLVVLDLGASPGGWSDYILWRFLHPSVAPPPTASAKVKVPVVVPPPPPDRCLLLSCDLAPFPPPPNANPKYLKIDPAAKHPEWQLVVGDFTAKAIQEDLAKRIVAFLAKGASNPSLSGSVDLVLSDMASNTTGDSFTDCHRTNGLLRSALDFVSGGGHVIGGGNTNEKRREKPLLAKGGAFVGKFFIGGDDDADIVKMFRTSGRWKTVKVFKPDASRKESKEAFLVARGFKG